MSKIANRSFREAVLGEVGFKRVNSKVKGNRNEVEVAKALTKWTGKKFRRTPASGAIHVPLHWLAGDVFCTADGFDFPFTVETKHYKKVTPGLIKKWWRQACEDANRVDKIPMLIYRENGWPAGSWNVLIGHPYINATAIGSDALFLIDYNEFVKSIS